MSLTRMAITAVCSIGLGLLPAGSLATAEWDAVPGEQPGKQPKASQPRPPVTGADTSKLRPQADRPRPPFGRFGPRGPARSADPRRQGDMQPSRMGRGPGGPPGRDRANGPGRSKPFGPPEGRGRLRLPQPAAHGMRHPGGPPRWPHHDWDDLEKGDPDMYKLLKNERELERQTIELAIQYRRSPEQQRPAIKKQLEETVGEPFEARQARRQLELKRLEEELKRLREAIQRRSEMRDALVEKRTSELLGEKGLEF